MANTKSAQKKIKEIKKRTIVNRIRIGKYKKAVSDIEKLIINKEKLKAQKMFSNFQSQLMKVSKKGSIKRLTASRKIARIAARIAKLS
jgi:small subunit ribosomal protein S20